MTDHPMTCQAPMICALLNGTKTQDRRILHDSQITDVREMSEQEKIELVRSGWNLTNDLSAVGSHLFRVPIAIGDRIIPNDHTRPTLNVTGIRVQRLQDISAADAIAEGVDPYNDPPEQMETPAGDAFMDLWNSICGPDAWDANPWVVAYSFDVVKGNIDAN